MADFLKTVLLANGATWDLFIVDDVSVVFKADGTCKFERTGFDGTWEIVKNTIDVRKGEWVLKIVRGECSVVLEGGTTLINPAMEFEPFFLSFASSSSFTTSQMLTPKAIPSIEDIEAQVERHNEMLHDLARGK